MTGVLWLIFWQACGLSLSFRLFGSRRQAVRIWLGSVFGLLLSIWAPIPFSFLFGFRTVSHLLGAVTGTVLISFMLLLSRRGGRRLSETSPYPSGTDRPLLWLIVPFMALGAFLLFSHTIPEHNGSLYTGQATYGDMSMHLGFITSLAEQGTFPPFYSILPSERISYPFLCDSVSSSLYLLGLPLRMAYILPMLLAFAQVYAGLWFLAREICHKKNAPVLSFLLFFLNGGLGMVYYIHDVPFRELFTGFYKTPTNLTEHGMRWVNVIADMMLPQRATLFGWAFLIPALYLLYLAVFKGERRCFLAAGIVGGLLPMIHTHSFFALGIIAASWLVYTGLRDRCSRHWMASWAMFGLTALALAIPQLIIWTFHSVGGNDSFLRFHFDWVNEGNENWLWFWLKNIGPLFLIAPVVYLFGNRETRALLAGPFFLFLLCESVVFQPNVYDNNKLMYVSYMFVCIVCSDAILRWTGSLNRPLLRRAILSVLIIVCLNAGVFTLIREVLSGIPAYGYELFNADEVAAAGFIKESTAPDAVFLTDDNHDNAVAVLTGRNILCGSPSYLFYHGLDYEPYKKLEEDMLTDENVFRRELVSSGVSYVYVSQYERSMPGLILPYLEANYPAVFVSDSVIIYDVR